MKQFRSREDGWPFRMPHDALDLDAVVGPGSADGVPVRTDLLRGRVVLRFEWRSGDVWELWVIALPSGVQIYCDTNGRESRVLASAKRGTPSDADGFFLERLAESRGHLFGIEMAGPPPDRVKSSIGDREFLADVFVDLFEGTDAERALGAGPDFRAVVAGWLERVLTAPPMTRRQPRVRIEKGDSPL